jgi:hypothetical protein
MNNHDTTRTMQKCGTDCQIYTDISHTRTQSATFQTPRKNKTKQNFTTFDGSTSAFMSACNLACLVFLCEISSVFLALSHSLTPSPPHPPHPGVAATSLGLAESMSCSISFFSVMKSVGNDQMMHSSRYRGCRSEHVSCRCHKHTHTHTYTHTRTQMQAKYMPCTIYGLGQTYSLSNRKGSARFGLVKVIMTVSYNSKQL